MHFKSLHFHSFIHPTGRLVWLSRVKSRGGAAVTGLSWMLCTLFSAGVGLGIGGSGWRAVWLCWAWRLSGCRTGELSGCPCGLKATLVEPSLGGGGLRIGEAGLSSGGRCTNSLGDEPWVSSDMELCGSCMVPSTKEEDWTGPRNTLSSYSHPIPCTIPYTYLATCRHCGSGKPITVKTTAQHLLIQTSPAPGRCSD